MSKTVTAILLGILATVANAAGKPDEPKEPQFSWPWENEDYQGYVEPTPPPAPVVKKVDVTITKKTIEVVKEKETVEVDLVAYCKPLIKCMSTCMVEPYWQFFADAKYECFKEYPTELQFCQAYMKEYFNEHGIEMPDFEEYSKADWAPKGDVSRDKIIEATKTLEKTVTKTMVTKVKKVTSIVKPEVERHGYGCLDIYDKHDCLKPYKEVEKACEAKETALRKLIDKKVIKSPCEVEYEPESEKKCDKISYGCVLDCEYMKKHYGLTGCEKELVPTYTYEKDDTPAITVKITGETVTLFKQADTLQVSTAAFCKPLIECIGTAALQPYSNFFVEAQNDCFATFTTQFAVCQSYIPTLLSSFGVEFRSFGSFFAPEGEIDVGKVIDIVQFVEQTVTRSEENAARRARNDIDNAASSQVVLKFKRGAYYAIEDIRRFAQKARDAVKEFRPFKDNVIKCPTEVDECPSARKHCSEITRKAIVDKDALEKDYGAKFSYSDGEMNISWD